MQNIPNVATSNINIWFLMYSALSEQRKLDLIESLVA